MVTKYRSNTSEFVREWFMLLVFSDKRRKSIFLNLQTRKKKNIENPIKVRCYDTSLNLHLSPHSSSSPPFLQCTFLLSTFAKLGSFLFW